MIYFYALYSFFHSLGLATKYLSYQSTTMVEFKWNSQLILLNESCTIFANKSVIHWKCIHICVQSACLQFLFRLITYDKWSWQPSTKRELTVCLVEWLYQPFLCWLNSVIVSFHFNISTSVSLISGIKEERECRS